jgi:hypothetical protein
MAKQAPKASDVKAKAKATEAKRLETLKSKLSKIK